MSARLLLETKTALSDSKRPAIRMIRSLVFDAVQRPVASGVRRVHQLVQRAHLRALKRRGRATPETFAMFTKAPVEFCLGSKTTIYYPPQCVPRLSLRLRRHAAARLLDGHFRVRTVVPIHGVVRSRDGHFFLRMDSIHRVLEFDQADLLRHAPLHSVSELTSTSGLNASQARTLIEALRGRTDLLRGVLTALRTAALIGCGGGVANLSVVRNRKSPAKIVVRDLMVARGHAPSSASDRGGALFDRASGYGPNQAVAPVFKDLDAKRRRGGALPAALRATVAKLLRVTSNVIGKREKILGLRQN